MSGISHCIRQYLRLHTTVGGRRDFEFAALQFRVDPVLHYSMVANYLNYFVGTFLDMRLCCFLLMKTRICRDQAD